MRRDTSQNLRQLLRHGGSQRSFGSIDFTNPRTIVPAIPFAAYGGVKVHF
jgi:hypothetical protein